MVGDGEEVRFDWRRGGAAAAGLVAALVLVTMVFLVKFANDARENALAAERQANQVSLIVRNVSANVARAEAALARFVLDEKIEAQRQSSTPAPGETPATRLTSSRRSSATIPSRQRALPSVQQLYDKRGEELALAARAALAKQGDTGISYFYPPRARARRARAPAACSTTSSRKSSAPSAGRSAAASSRARSSRPRLTGSPII